MRGNAAAGNSAIPNNRSSRPGVRSPARRGLAVALCLLLALTAVECLSDLVVTPPEGDYSWGNVTTNDSLDIGDTLSLPTVTLSLGPKPLQVRFTAEVVSGGTAFKVESLGGATKLIVLGPGDGVVRVRPVSAGLTTDTLHLDFTFHATVPRLVKPATESDSLFSINDSTTLTANAQSSHGVPLSGIGVTWSVVSGGSVVQLVNAATGRVTALTNGDAVLKATSDSATLTRTIRVRQRAASVTPSGRVALHAFGQTWQLSKQVKDARGNVIAGGTVSFASGTPATATVNGVTGLVTTVANGTTVVSGTGSGPGGATAAAVSRDTVVVAQAQLAALPGTWSQTASIGVPLPAPFVAQLVDGANNPVADSGIAVTFQLVSGDGKFGATTSAVVRTDLQGRAQAVMTLGPNLDDDSVSASGTGLTGGAARFTAQPAQPVRLRFLQGPTTLTAGGVFTPSVRVTVRDQFDSVVTTAPGFANLGIVAGTGTAGAQLLGTAQQTLVNGQATFGNVSLDKAGTGYRLQTNAPGLVADTSATFTVGIGVADHLAFLVQPSNAVTGGAITPALQVQARDAFDNPVSSYAGLVTLLLGNNPGNATLPATNAVAVGGVATFSGVALNKPGTGYTLIAASGTLFATSTAFNVVGAPANIVVVSGDQQNAIVSQTLPLPFVVQVLDATSTPVPGDTVIFKVTTGGGKIAGIDSAIVVTDAQGKASASLTLGAAAGANAVVARSKRLGASPSVTFNASGTPSGLDLEFTGQPSNRTGGQVFSPAITVRVKDATNATVTSATSFITLSVLGGTPGAHTVGTVSVAAVAGVATFSSVALDSAGTGYRLIASAGGIAPDTSAAFDVTVGAATQLLFRQQPDTLRAGAPGSRSFDVVIADAGGNVVTAAANPVSVALAAGRGTAGANLRGATPMAAAAGVASFGALSVDSAGTNYALTATAAGLASATSGAFVVLPAPPHVLAFGIAPATGTAGAQLPTVQVLVRDSVGNTVTSATTPVTVVLGGGATGQTGGTLAGTVTVAAVSGIATFSDLRVRRAAAGYTLSAQASGLTTSPPASFDVVPGGASRLAFLQPPTTTTPATIIAPAVTVQVLDSTGLNVAPAATNAVTLAVTGGTPALGGTATVSAVAGLATFSDLTIATAATNITLSATASGLAGATSATFSILSAASNRLAFGGLASGYSAGAAFSGLTVSVVDGSNAVVTGATDSITLAITAGTGTAGAHLLGTVGARAVAGVASFGTINIDSAGAGYTLTATAAGLANATSGAFPISSGVATQLTYVAGAQPTNRTAGAAFTPSPQVAVRDAFGNLVTVAADAITLAITPGTGAAGATLSGTATVNAVNGVATFAGLSIAKAGTGYTLTATRSGYSSAVSNTFSIAVGAAARVVVSPAGGSTPIGGSQQFAAQIEDAFGNVVTGTVAWSSLNGAVAAVGGTGLASAVGVGQVTVAATGGGKTGYALLNVTAPTAQAANTWAVPTAPGNTRISRVWGAQANDAWAAGNDGMLLRWNGSAWSQVSSPTADTLRGLWGSSANDVYAVGFNGRIIHWNGSAWSVVTSPTTKALLDAWGSGPNDVWAVGSAGAIAHYDGTSWSNVTSPSAAVLNGVWGASPTDVWVAAGSGELLHWDGAAWSTVNSGTLLALSGVWGTSSNDVFVSGLGIMLHWNGGSWSPMTVPTAGNLRRVWGTSSSDVYAVGGPAGGGTVLRYNGISWDSLRTPSDSLLFSVFGLPGSNQLLISGAGVLPVGSKGATLNVTPATATLSTVGATQPLTVDLRDFTNAVVSGVPMTFVSSDTTTATVNGSGLVTAVRSGQVQIIATAKGGLADTVAVTVALPAASVTLSAASATMSSAGPGPTLTGTPKDQFGRTVPGASVTWSSLNTAVATVGAGSGVVSAVSSGQAILAATSGSAVSYALATVSLAPAAPVNLLATIATGVSDNLQYGLWGTSETNLYAVGSTNRVYRWDGSTFTSLAGAGNVNNIWGSSPAELFAVGNTGLVGRSTNGTTFVFGTEAAAGANNLRGIWGTAPNNVYSGGAASGGVVMRWNGTSWSALSPKPGDAQCCNNVYGFDANDIWAVGRSTSLLHFTGAKWDTVVVAGASLEAVWGPSSGDVFAVGGSGLILHWNGTGWTQQGSGVTANTLNRVWGSSGADVYAVGDNGTLLRYNGATWSALPTGTSQPLFGVWATDRFIFVAGSNGLLLRGYRGASVAATPASVNLQTSGTTTQQLTVTAKDAQNNTVAGVTFSYTSSNTGVATVSGSGLVTAVAVGNANVIVTAPGGAADTVPVSVTTAAVASVVVAPDSATLLTVGATRALTATGRDAGNNTIPGVTFTWTSLNPAVATVDPSGTVSAVASGQAAILATSGSVSGTALVTVSITPAQAVNLWAPMTSGTSQPLYAVWGTSNSNVFASGESGTLLRYDGTSWTPQNSNATAGLTDLWGASATDVTVVGFGAVIRRYNGSIWTTPSTTIGAGFLGVWGVSANETYAIGTFQSGSAFSYLARWNGTSWAKQDSLVGSTYLRAIWGTKGTNSFAVGDNGTIMRWNGSTWASTIIGTQGLNSVWGSSGSDVYAVGQSGTVLHFNGTSWATGSTTGLGTTHVAKLWGTSATEMYAASGSVAGDLLRFNGTTWTTISTGSTGYFQDLWASSNSDWFTVGTGGAILRGYRGASVSVTPATKTFTAFTDTLTFTATAKDAANTTVSGVTFAWSSDATGVATVNATTGKVTVVGNGTAHITATAPGGASGQATITVAQSVYSVIVTTNSQSATVGLGTATFTAVARDSLGQTVASPTFTWASSNTAIATVSAAGVATPVANGQAIISATANGRSGEGVFTVANTGLSAVNLWAPMTSNTTNDLQGVWGTTASNIFAVGANGTIVRYNGSTWSLMTSNTSQNLMEVTGTGASDVTAVGTSATAPIVRYNGSAWATVSLAGLSLAGAWQAGTADGYAMGTGTNWARLAAGTWTSTSGAVTSSAVWGLGRGKVFSVNGVVAGSAQPIRYDTTTATWVADGTFSAAGGSLVMRGLWGASTTTAFAVGGSSAVAGATMTPRTLQYNGSGWAFGPSSSTGRTLNAAGGGSNSDIYMVGDTGTVMRYNGSTLTSQSGATTKNLNAVWAAPNGDVFAVGNGGVILRGYRGATITVVGGPITLGSLGRQDTVTATGPGGVALSGVRWSSTNTAIATVDSLTGIVTAVANGSASIVATAPGGVTGSTSVTVAQVTASVIVTPAATINIAGSATFAASAFDSLGGGISGASFTWTSLNQAVAAVSPAGSVTGVATGQAVIRAVKDGVSGYGLITVRSSSAVNMGSWGAMTTGTTASLSGVWGMNANYVIAVGAATIIRWNGTSWAAMPGTTTYSFNDVWGVDSTFVLAVGSNKVVRWNGTTWSDFYTASSTLLAVWGSSPADVFVAGTSGAMLHYDGTSWSPMTTGSTQNFSDVWGTARNNVFAVSGTNNEVLRYNGASWGAEASNVTGNIYGLGGSDGTTEVYLATATATSEVRRRGGSSSWSNVNNSLTAGLYGVYAPSPSSIYFVGGYFSGGVWNTRVNRYGGSGSVANVFSSSALNTYLTDIWGIGNAAFAVGINGQILRGAP